MQFGAVEFEVDKAKLLKQTKRLTEKLRREREAREKEHSRRVTDVKAQIESARSQVRRFRNDKRNPEFAAAKGRVAALQGELERLERGGTDESEFDSLVETMHRAKTAKREELESRSSVAREKMRGERLKRHFLKHPTTEHPRDWNFSVNSYGQLHTPFMPLGASRPKMLRKKGTRFGPPPKGKKAWRAVPDGLLFGYTPPPRLLQTGWGPFKEDPDMDDFADDDEAARIPGDSTKRLTDLQKRKKLEDRRREKATREADMKKSKLYRGSRGAARPWTQGCAVPKIFSEPDYNRPMTAHERAIAAKLSQADRALFQPSKGGPPPFRPGSRVAKMLHEYEANVTVQLRREAEAKEKMETFIAEATQEYVDDEGSQDGF